MKGLYLSCGLLVLLLLWTLLVIADAAGVANTDRGGAGRGQRRGGGGGAGGGAEKRKRFHRIQHGQCSYTFILPELDGCQGTGPTSQTEQYGGSRGGASVVQRDSPSMYGELSAQKLQHLQNTMENNTQWLQKTPVVRITVYTEEYLQIPLDLSLEKHLDRAAAALCSIILYSHTSNGSNQTPLTALITA
eukprot:superscaffoldBa00002748_g15176